MLQLQHIILALCRFFREADAAAKPNVYINPADYKNMCIDIEKSDTGLSIRTRKYTQIMGCSIIEKAEIPRGVFYIGFLCEIDPNDSEIKEGCE